MVAAGRVAVALEAVSVSGGRPEPPVAEVVRNGRARLASGGVDYGSDLDILITYDSLVPSPIESLTQDETYARLAELMIAALSSISEGMPYTVLEAIGARVVAPSPWR